MNAVISPTAKFGPDVVSGHYVVIGDNAILRHRVIAYGVMVHADMQLGPQFLQNCLPDVWAELLRRRGDGGA